VRKEFRMKALVCIVGALSMVLLAARGRDGGTVTAVKATEVKWEKCEGMPEGVMKSAVQGDMKTGPFLALLKFPAGTKIMLHTHPENTAVSVVTGTLVIGEEGLPGDKGKEVGPGGYFKVPAQTQHWTWAKTECVFTVYGDGAHDLKYVGGGGEKSSD
jgi:quercetin dioxygenase-like cupin family protein